LERQTGGELAGSYAAWKRTIGSDGSLAALPKNAGIEMKTRFILVNL